MKQIINYLTAPAELGGRVHRPGGFGIMDNYTMNAAFVEAGGRNNLRHLRDGDTEFLRREIRRGRE